MCICCSVNYPIILVAVCTSTFKDLIDTWNLKESHTNYSNCNFMCTDHWLVSYYAYSYTVCIKSIGYCLCAWYYNKLVQISWISTRDFTCWILYKKLWYDTLADGWVETKHQRTALVDITFAVTVKMFSVSYVTSSNAVASKLATFVHNSPSVVNTCVYWSTCLTVLTGHSTAASISDRWPEEIVLLKIVFVGRTIST